MENDTKKLKEIVKSQNKKIKKLSKEIKIYYKNKNCLFEKDYILLLKSINKRYKMQCLTIHKCNNDYIELFLYSILKIITNALNIALKNKKYKFNITDYKYLVDELKICFEIRVLINETCLINDGLLVEIIDKVNKIYSEMLKRLEINKINIDKRLVEKESEYDAIPSQVLELELDSIKDEYLCNQIICDEIKFNVKYKN